VASDVATAGEAETDVTQLAAGQDGPISEDRRAAGDAVTPAASAPADEAQVPAPDAPDGIMTSAAPSETVISDTPGRNGAGGGAGGAGGTRPARARRPRAAKAGGARRNGTGPEAAADEGLPGGTETILLVEDDQTMRVAAQQLLSKVGYRVITAADGQQGLDAYHAHRAALHLVITDVVMPKLSGFELYEVIRGESRGLRVLFMSGFPAPNFRKTVGQDPAVAFVTKPWTASELLAQVRVLIEASHA